MPIASPCRGLACCAPFATSRIALTARFSYPRAKEAPTLRGGLFQILLCFLRVLSDLCVNSFFFLMSLSLYILTSVFSQCTASSPPPTPPCAPPVVTQT